MSCPYCYGENGCHDIRCPNFEENTDLDIHNFCREICYFCGEYIFRTEKCVLNEDKTKYAHFDCLKNAGLDDIIDFFGGKKINEF